MKTYNPIRHTVVNFVATKGRRHKKTSETQKKEKPKKSKISVFFNDLENRGPFKPGTFFEAWTKQIRIKMQELGTWIKEEEENNLAFVAEYLNRLQIIFLDDGEKRRLSFKKIYVKIRVWGLRMKLFEIKKWEGSFFISRRSHVYPYYTPKLYESDFYTYVFGDCGMRRCEFKSTKKSTQIFNSNSVPI
jgi:hypothetical protein